VDKNIVNLRMRKIILGITALFLLTGCSGGTTGSAQVTKEGVIKAKVGTEYVMQAGQDMVNITSDKINLDQYLKKEIEVKGMFSGSTLYVDEVKEK
jgi:PBP1b-binding outer membrane lipoprotein LpoB